MNSSIYSETDLKYEITRVFMNKEIDKALIMTKNYIKNNGWDIDNDFFEILFDLYKITNDKDRFIDLANKYAKRHGTLPKIWESKKEQKMLSLKNLLVVEGSMNEQLKDKFNQFKIFAKQNKFARLDFNKIDILKSNSVGLRLLLNLLYDLKLSDANILIMGDNKILDFNSKEQDEFEKLKQKIKKHDIIKNVDLNILIDKTQQEDDDYFVKHYEAQDINQTQKKNLISDYHDNVAEIQENEFPDIFKEIDEIEKLIYLLKLELLQWKGYENSYIELSMQYMNKYGMFPPDYKKEYQKLVIDNVENRNGNNGITSIEFTDSVGLSNSKNEVLKFHIKEINAQNVHYLTQYLSSNNNMLIYIDFDEVNIFTYEAAIALLDFLKDFRLHSKYEIFILNTNKMIQLIFQMTGLNEHISVAAL